MTRLAILALLAAALPLVRGDGEDDILAETKKEAEASAEDDHDSATSEDAPDYDPEHPLTDMPESAATMEVSSAVFVGYPEKKFPIGGTVDVMFTMTNTGSSPYNVTAAMGSLNLPVDFDYYYRNFTRKQYNQVVSPQVTEEGKKKINEYTFVYTFDTDKYSDSKEYLAALTVFYESNDETFSTTFFNSTITLVDANTGVDVTQMVMFVITLLVGAAGVYWVMNTFCGCKSSKKKRPKKSKSTVSTAGPSTGSLKVADASKGKQVFGKKKKKKKSKK